MAGIWANPEHFIYQKHRFGSLKTRLTGLHPIIDQMCSMAVENRQKLILTTQTNLTSCSQNNIWPPSCSCYPGEWVKQNELKRIICAWIKPPSSRYSCAYFFAIIGSKYFIPCRDKLTLFRFGCWQQ